MALPTDSAAASAAAASGASVGATGMEPVILAARALIAMSRSARPRRASSSTAAATSTAIAMNVEITGGSMSAGGTSDSHTSATGAVGLRRRDGNALAGFDLSLL